MKVYTYSGRAGIESWGKVLPSVDFTMTVKVYSDGGIDIELHRVGRSTKYGSYARPGPDWSRTALQYAQSVLKDGDSYSVVRIREEWT